MLDLKVDPKTKTIELSVLLLGESEPLEVSVKSYDLIERDGKDFLKIGEVQTSKTWLNIMVNEFARGDEVEIPSKIAKLLKIVM